MPYIHIKKIWTPLELFGIELFYDSEAKAYYVKRKNKTLRKLF